MWKVSLALVFHRILLLAVALLSLNLHSVVNPDPKLATPIRAKSFSTLCREFASKVSETPEAQLLDRLTKLPLSATFRETRNPFMWLLRLIIAITHLPILFTMIVVSNVFLFLFLWELNALMSRMVTPDTAISATILMLLWPTSYELSLGSPLVFSAFLSTMAVRHALDDQWLIGGIALALLATVEPLAAGLIPLLGYLFWYFQRGYPASDVIKKLVWLFVPVLGVMFWHRSVYLDLGTWIHSSALLALFSNGAFHGALAWSFSQTLAGQTITAIFFLTGAVAACVSNSTLIHRLIPIYSGLLWLLFSPYGALASRAPLAGICLQGIASISARPALRVIQILLLSLSLFEVSAVFM